MTADGPRPTATGPLAGVRVVEMGQLIAGPFCGQILGDLGAEVIKLEQPGTGDPMREWGQSRPRGESLWWAVVGRNKKSVTVNLRTPDGQDVARRLIASSDVVTENFRPGTLERWGMDYETLSSANPGLVLARVSGFGQTGPYSSRAGYGSIGEAMGGLRYVVGDPSTPPSRVGISIGDTLAALFAAIGTLGAVYERTRSGRGQVVDSAIYEAVLGVMESIVPEWVVANYQRERSGATLPGIAPSNVYPTRDGAWILVAANQDTVFARLADAMGQPELATDDRFRTHTARGERQQELDAMVADFTVRYDAHALESLLQDHAVPVGKIYRPADMLSDKQFAARDSIVETAHPVLGTVPMQNAFPRLSRTDSSVRWPGPALGEHTREVLTKVAGYDADDLARLAADGVI
ncbi:MULTISPECIES: CaiB/BaiF CoA transferase family protein [Nocardiaceae]|uniref:CoA transferase n=1 Tax=Rhodococcoides kroppenstedtii TaxID=293050 RepID=A0ABS7NX94_9NOCA|nr:MULTISPECIES: CaiB/BaiF CoA-transferase family protein [Rhodococcus]AMY20247.1 Succinyl-CoA--L-malate CoA-transferase beta subunit [Rhodococcus sp. PBTS 1]MBY6314899.1 CoA transferase [Rhodococcus kroppenstedtii]MBY6322635.1 CoA transferase [Rhodococcus kroppenstedtii]MBY6399935.1 CoA transferase [Rhodococcus kroppenstedtii]